MSTTSQPLTWGILGFGRHAERKMLPAFEQAELAELRGIGSRNPRTADGFASSSVKVYDSYEACLDNPEIDAVYIGLPNHLHAEWSIRALQTGKHVLCDKPAGMDLAEVEAMQSAAKEAGRKLHEGFMYRFHPQHQIVRERIANGEIGEVRLFEVHFHFSLDRKGDIRFNPECGGGGLLDVGCYTVDSSRFILGRSPQRLSATWQIGEETGVDESLFAQLIYDEGVSAHLSCGVQFGWSNTYTVYGTKGLLRVPSAFVVPANKKTLIEKEGFDGKKERIEVQPCCMFTRELDLFAQWVSTGEVDSELFGDGLENARILSALRAAASERKEINL